ncbi:uncharacterized protein LOC126896614 [Daktulosphaira vitifoliae]|uniref:uncharacterized protein LOC126896614 n=1 Tax=Daktulosphaira vitifoliae TaxID=58002 RepID=UPI0021AAEAAB|nr:uncharacterized protein LOC126896614 [Daktulosphaira vitifoliae]
MIICMKINIIFFILYFVSSVKMREPVYYVSQVNNWDDRPNNIEVTPLKNDHYFRPVSNEWKKNKCQSLGLQFNEIIFRSYDNDIYLNNTLPKILTIPSLTYDVDQKNNCIFEALSLAICGNKSYFKQIRGKVLDNLKNSKELKNFLGSERRFKNYLLLKNNGNLVDDYGSVTEVLATAEYLDVCIYVYVVEYKQWVLHRKDWPNYESINMKSENCIYLKFCNQSAYVVTAISIFF